MTSQGGGTDIVYQKIDSYTCKPKSRKWTMAAFAYLVDTCRVNAQTVLKLNGTKMSSFDFVYGLAKGFITPVIRARPLTGLQAPIKMKMSLVMPDLNIDNAIRIETDGLVSHYHTEQKGRCRMCVDGLKGPDHKKYKNQLSRIRSICQMCQEFLCKEHSVILCKNCWQKK